MLRGCLARLAPAETATGTAAPGTTVPRTAAALTGVGTAVSGTAVGIADAVVADRPSAQYIVGSFCPVAGGRSPAVSVERQGRLRRTGSGHDCRYHTPIEPKHPRRTRRKL